MCTKKLMENMKQYANNLTQCKSSNCMTPCSCAFVIKQELLALIEKEEGGV